MDGRGLRGGGVTYHHIYICILTALFVFPRMCVCFTIHPRAVSLILLYRARWIWLVAP